jgi:glycosyltransferase involved in cell wall biosynthesis
MVKGIDILIQSWKSLPAEYKDTAHLSIFGTGTLESFVRKEIQGEASLSFHGMAKPQDVADYGSMCDWMVIPSRNESIPVIFSDAMQLHLPVIVSDVGDMGDLVRDNSIGHIVQPGDTQSLQDALLKGMTEETDYSTYKHNTEIVSQKFSVHESVRQFMENVRSYR